MANHTLSAVKLGKVNGI